MQRKKKHLTEIFRDCLKTTKESRDEIIKVMISLIVEHPQIGINNPITYFDILVDISKYLEINLNNKNILSIELKIVNQIIKLTLQNINKEQKQNLDALMLKYAKEYSCVPSLKGAKSLNDVISSEQISGAIPFILTLIAFVLIRDLPNFQHLNKIESEVFERLPKIPVSFIRDCFTKKYKGTKYEKILPAVLFVTILRHGSPRAVPFVMIKRPQIGDHLISPRNGYTHHGIYIGDGKVIHYSGLSDATTSGKVEEVSIKEFTSGNTCYKKTHSNPKFSPEDIVKRAREQVGQDKYSIFFNNCEHLCEYCINGRRYSHQVVGNAKKLGKFILNVEKQIEPFNIGYKIGKRLREDSKISCEDVLQLGLEEIDIKNL